MKTTIVLFVVMIAGNIVLGEDKNPSLSPVLDYHQHLLSPTMAKQWSTEPLKAVQLPNELNTLLLERERAYGNKDALAKLFTEDSVHFSSRSSSGIRGRQEVASFLADLFARPYKVTPVSFAVNGSSGYIA